MFGIECWLLNVEEVLFVGRCCCVCVFELCFGVRGDVDDVCCFVVVGEIRRVVDDGLSRVVESFVLVNFYFDVCFDVVVIIEFKIGL